MRAVTVLVVVVGDAQKGKYFDTRARLTPTRMRLTLHFRVHTSDARCKSACRTEARTLLHGSCNGDECIPAVCLLGYCGRRGGGTSLVLFVERCDGGDRAWGVCVCMCFSASLYARMFEIGLGMRVDVSHVFMCWCRSFLGRGAHLWVLVSGHFLFIGDIMTFYPKC